MEVRNENHTGDDDVPGHVLKFLGEGCRDHRTTSKIRHTAQVGVRKLRRRIQGTTEYVLEEDQL